MTVWAIILAAGAGGRFGGDKCAALVAGWPAAVWSVEAARDTCDGYVIVTATGHGAHAVKGGGSRSQSVRAGLAAVPVDADVIVVHDAARPAASHDLWRRVIDTVQAGAFCAVPALPVTDSLRRCDGPVSRDGVLAVQTPQAFRAAVLRAAHADGCEATDDASLVHPRMVQLVEGEPGNVKLTYPADLDVVDAVLRQAVPA